MGWKLWGALRVRSREWLALAGTSSVQLGKGPRSLTSLRLDRWQRQLRARALLQARAAPSSLHALASTGRKKGPRQVSLGRPPSRPPMPSEPFPRWPGSTWAAGHSQPSAPSSPLPCGSPGQCSPCLFCLYDWSWALCQRCTCTSSCDPRHKPLRQKP